MVQSPFWSYSTNFQASKFLILHLVDFYWLKLYKASLFRELCNQFNAKLILTLLRLNEHLIFKR